MGLGLGKGRFFFAYDIFYKDASINKAVHPRQDFWFQRIRRLAVEVKAICRFDIVLTLGNCGISGATVAQAARTAAATGVLEDYCKRPGRRRMLRGGQRRLLLLLLLLGGG